MTAPSSIDPARFLQDQLESASPDLLRSMLATFINALMSAEADAVCGAPYGLPGPDRVNVRNGYRHRDSGTRAGTLDVAIPKLRSGSYFPDWLLERRRRAEAALTSVVATCYLLGVSTRRMEKLVETLGITRLSRSQVSEMARDLDAQVGGVPDPAARRRALYLRGRRRAGAEGPRGRPRGERARAAGRRGER
jgi:putative transposase